jgi:hypothetical protein
VVWRCDKQDAVEAALVASSPTADTDPQSHRQELGQSSAALVELVRLLARQAVRNASEASWPQTLAED